MVGIAAAIRWVLVMSPVTLSRGTLKSTRTKTRWPARSRERRESFGIKSGDGEA